MLMTTFIISLVTLILLLGIAGIACILYKRIKTGFYTLSFAQKKFEEEQRDVIKEFIQITKCDLQCMKQAQIVFIEQQKTSFESFSQTLMHSIYLYESMLVSENGAWILQKDDVKKFFSPGKISHIEDSKNDTITLYEYNTTDVICTVKKAGKLKSKIIFSLNGTPKNGVIYDDNEKEIKSFEYDELGQVKEALRGGE